MRTVKFALIAAIVAAPLMLAGCDRKASENKVTVDTPNSKYELKVKTSQKP